MTIPNDFVECVTRHSSLHQKPRRVSCGIPRMEMPLKDGSSITTKYNHRRMPQELAFRITLNSEYKVAEISPN